MSTKVRRKPQSETFKRAIRKTLLLRPTTSTTHVAEPKRDPNIPRTEKESDVIESRILIPFNQHWALRSKDGTFTVLKSNPAIPSMKCMHNTSRAFLIRRVTEAGNTPSAYLSTILGIPAYVIGAIRRWHNPNWREQSNQYIRRVYSFDRF